MYERRITAGVRPSQVTVTHEFHCAAAGCDAKETKTFYGEAFYEEWPKGWRLVLRDVAWGEWICPAHEITLDGKALK